MHPRENASSVLRWRQLTNYVQQLSAYKDFNRGLQKCAVSSKFWQFVFCMILIEQYRLPNYITWQTARPSARETLDRWGHNEGEDGGMKVVKGLFVISTMDTVWRVNG